MKEPVLRVVAQRQHEYAEKAPEGEEDYPQVPLFGLVRHHAVDQQQEAEAGVGERGGERRRVHQAADGPLREELALEVVDDAGHAERDGAEADHESDAVRPGPADRVTASQHCRRKQQRRRNREDDGDPLGGVPEGVDRVGEEYVQHEEGEVRQDESLQQRGLAARRRLNDPHDRPAARRPSP